MIRTNKRNTQGAVAPLVAVMLVPMMAIVALALDGGMMFDGRRAVQAAADEAALSAAIELYTNYIQNKGVDAGGLAKKSAEGTAKANGFTTGNSTITVRTAGQLALDGRFKDTVLPAGYVEVTIDYRQSRGFSGLWGSGDLVIRGHAVARGAWMPVKNGVIALKPSGDATLKANGNGLIEVKNGDVIVNSNGGAAGTTAGGNAIVSTTGTYITGGYSGSGFTPTPQTGIAPTPDPLAHLPVPAQPTTNGKITVDRGKGGEITQVNLTPGYYNKNFFESNAKVVMAPGLYYFEKGFTITGQAGLTGNGVMIYNNATAHNENNSNRGIELTGQGVVNLTPMTTGVYQGITLFQNRQQTDTIKIVGQGNFSLSGTIYGASADGQIDGNGALKVAGQVILGTLNVGGNGSTIIDFNAPEAPNTRIMQLIE